jgi:hypothetical protein
MYARSVDVRGAATALTSFPPLHCLAPLCCVVGSFTCKLEDYDIMGISLLPETTMLLHLGG